ncbi:MAG: hypothetical protein ABSA33_01330 [Candidatus Micrarchaeaceae archaeon]|jgi:hypothetical protein
MAMDEDGPKHKQHKKMSTGTKIGIVLAIVVIAVALYYVVFLSVNQTVVGTPAVSNLTSTGTIFSVNSQQYLISLAGISRANGVAYIYVNKLPIFVNPLLNITLHLNNITKINAGSYYADMGIQLQSIGQNAITVKVSPLFTSLQIVPDSQYIRNVRSQLYQQGQSQSQSTSTIQSGQSPSVTTVTSTIAPASTSTISQTASIAAEINQTLKTNYLYSLLLNFSVLYTNTSNCNLARYNNLYFQVYGSAPTGPNTYQNVSQIVPYNLTESIASAGNGNYEVNFTTQAYSSFYNNVHAVVMVVNVSGKKVLNDTISGSGIFSGQTSTQIQQNYVHAKSEGACGPYV